MKGRVSKLFFFYSLALTAVCLFLFSSCSTGCRQWEIQEVLTKHPCFNAGRLVLGPDSNTSNLELELVRNRSGIRFYINLLLLQALPCKENPCVTKVEVFFEDEEKPWNIYPYLLEGGQRLLIPCEISDQFIQALLQERLCTVKIGRSQLKVIPDQFKDGYEKLLGIPIE